MGGGGDDGVGWLGGGPQDFSDSPEAISFFSFLTNCCQAQGQGQGQGQSQSQSQSQI